MDGQRDRQIGGIQIKVAYVHDSRLQITWLGRSRTVCHGSKPSQNVSLCFYTAVRSALTQCQSGSIIKVICYNYKGRGLSKYNICCRCYWLGDMPVCNLIWNDQIDWEPGEASGESLRSSLLIKKLSLIFHCLHVKWLLEKSFGARLLEGMVQSGLR